MLKLNQRISVEFVDEKGNKHSEIFGAEEFAQEFAELIWRNPQYRVIRILDRYSNRELHINAAGKSLNSVRLYRFGSEVLVQENDWDDLARATPYIQNVNCTGS